MLLFLTLYRRERFDRLGSLAGKSNSSSIKTSVLTPAARAYNKIISNGGSRFPDSNSEILLYAIKSSAPKRLSISD
ncbi:MAG TPA: hypothetical protein VFX96_13375 [Pyrinomonadaceae bacterium]|nr:hypothetical protein [Pyrinomonadaceae bacterium]